MDSGLEAIARIQAQPCRVRGCELDAKAHGRTYDHIEETEGRAAADVWIDEHQPIDADDDD